MELEGSPRGFHILKVMTLMLFFVGKIQGSGVTEILP